MYVSLISNCHNSTIGPTRPTHNSYYSHYMCGVARCLSGTSTIINLGIGVLYLSVPMAGLQRFWLMPIDTSLQEQELVISRTYTVQWLRLLKLSCEERHRLHSHQLVTMNSVWHVTCNSVPELVNEFNIGEDIERMSMHPQYPVLIVESKMALRLVPIKFDTSNRLVNVPTWTVRIEHQTKTLRGEVAAKFDAKHLVVCGKTDHFTEYHDVVLLDFSVYMAIHDKKKDQDEQKENILQREEGTQEDNDCLAQPQPQQVIQERAEEQQKEVKKRVREHNEDAKNEPKEEKQHLETEKKRSRQE